MILEDCARIDYYANAMIESLPHIPLFYELEPEQVFLLKRLFETFACPPDVVIFEQGEAATYLYWLIKGEALIQYKPYDGPPLVLTRLRAGDVFGWSAALGNRYYTSSVISESQIEATRIRGTHLLQLIQDYPETGKIILERLARSVSPRWKNAHNQFQSILNLK